MAIAIPAIGNVIGSAEEDAHDANVELIENAAKLAALSNGTDNAIYDLDTLVQDGFLDSIPEDAGSNSYAGSDDVVVTNGVAVYTNYADDSI